MAVQCGFYCRWNVLRDLVTADVSDWTVSFDWSVMSAAVCLCLGMLTSGHGGVDNVSGVLSLEPRSESDLHCQSSLDQQLVITPETYSEVRDDDVEVSLCCLSFPVFRLFVLGLLVFQSHFVDL